MMIFYFKMYSRILFANVEKTPRVRNYLRSQHAWWKREKFNTRPVSLIGWFVNLHPRATWTEGFEAEIEEVMRTVEVDKSLESEFIQREIEMGRRGQQQGTRSQYFCWSWQKMAQN